MIYKPLWLNSFKVFISYISTQRRHWDYNNRNGVGTSTLQLCFQKQINWTSIRQYIDFPNEQVILQTSRMNLLASRIWTARLPTNQRNTTIPLRVRCPSRWMWFGSELRKGRRSFSSQILRASHSHISLVSARQTQTRPDIISLGSPSKTSLCFHHHEHRKRIAFLACVEQITDFRSLIFRCWIIRPSLAIHILLI